MEDFLIKLQNISKQSDKLIWEKNIIEKRIVNVQENISRYEEMKLKYAEEVAVKKSQLIKNKNKHLIKCQKMEELNRKLNEILIRKQNIDEEENKIVVIKQIDVINKMFHLLKNIQKLSDSLEMTREHYTLITEQIHNNNFNNRKTINIINSLLKKNLVHVQDMEEEEEKEKEETEKEIETSAEKEREKGKKTIENEVKIKDGSTKTESIVEENKSLKIIPTKEINTNLIKLFSQCHTNLTLEKQQFLFVFLMNVLSKIQNMHIQMMKKKNEAKNEMVNEKETTNKNTATNANMNTEDANEVEKQNEKQNQIIYKFLYKNYITIQ